ncbi:glycosyltransferase [Candidatus Peregrinibacteria bacterium]|nr:glycosyltransferase [Candidatus Peregrinibacteria bacterium]
MNKVTVSICFITKNEEETLDRCLKSLKGLVDEIIVVDTGSTDKTVKIAKKYRAKVFQFPWQDDFSLARNFALSKATKTWTMWLDADDVLSAEHYREIKKYLSKVNKKTDGIMVPYVLSTNKVGTPERFTNRLRVFRTEKNIRFKYPIHEILETKGIQLEYIKSAYVLHAPKAEKNSFQRNITILLQTIKSKKYAQDFHILFHIGKEYQRAGQMLKAINAYKKAFTNAKNTNDRYNSLIRIAQCSISKKKLADASNYAHQALKIDAKRPESLEIIASIKAEMGHIESANFWKSLSEQIPQKISNQVMKWSEY